MTNKKMKKMQKQDGYFKFGIALTILSIVTAGLGISTLYFATRAKTIDEQKYLDAYSYIMSQIASECSNIRGRNHLTINQDENGNKVSIEKTQATKFVNCDIDKYGISSDGDPYVSFNYRELDSDTGEVILNGHSTLYFQRNTDSGYYATAVGD
ncbi:hypothetical protein IJ765_02120 [Candidatus Saccharibacteria bacterium]|nr:hypothetical protein [Candidatus Saccharibacteria bacterium]